MPLPTPSVALKGHCSVIYKNTLYTYQADAFQSLELKDGAEWSRLSMGVATNGSTCVQGSTNGQDALFIVGGRTVSSSQEYSGLQRYTFSDGRWETFSPASNVTRNLQNHGSAFLSSSSSILIYGGSQDSASTPSSQTFSISTKPPYDVQAFSSKAPPVADPLMMPWNQSHALLLGGNPTSKALFIFGPQAGWHQLKATLQSAVAGTSQVQAAIMSLDDGSKVLELFDMGVSPNKISTLLLQNATHSGTFSQPSSSSNPSSASPSSTASSSSLTKVTINSPSRLKRATALDDRPAYNSTLAPQETRNGFSLAQGSDGLIVASGGNDQDVLSMFNQTGNQWIDANQFFGESKAATPKPTPSTVSPAASLSSMPSPSPSPPPASGGSRNRSLTILGATLGAVFGVAALLVLLLLILRCVRKRREDKRRSSEYPMDDKHDMDFADQGADFMKEAGGSFGKDQSGHQHKTSGHSASSMAIMGGKRNSSQQSKRALFHRPGNSDGSVKSFFGRAKSPTATSPPQISEQFMDKYAGQAANPQTSPNPRTEPRTDAGWSRYWNNSSSNINALAAGPARQGSQSRPATYTSTSQSDYESSRVTSSQPHESAEVKPLNLRSSQIPSNSRVVSPTSGLPLQPGLALSSGNHAEREPPTPTTLVSDIDEEDEYRNHRGLEPEGTSSWTPIDTSDRSSTWQDRPVSSVYTDSMYYPHPGERVRIPNFPGVPSRRPSQRQKNQGSNIPVRRPSQNSSSQGSSDPNRGARSGATRDFISPPPQPQPPPMPTQDPPNTRRVLPGYGTHEVRTFPRRTDELGSRGRGSRDTQDMSWLNLPDTR
ncbi:MAG: hypothetical protein Q9191_004844 [Dirinaria sp. TL-2023a]